MMCMDATHSSTTFLSLFDPKVKEGRNVGRKERVGF